MKLMSLLFLIALLAGCTRELPYAEAERSNRLCEDHGGVKAYYTTMIQNQVVVVCNDGSNIIGHLK